MGSTSHLICFVVLIDFKSSSVTKLFLDVVKILQKMFCITFAAIGYSFLLSSPTRLRKQFGEYAELLVWRT